MNCEGIVSLPFHLPLEESINKVVKALDVQGVVLITAPSGSGKTGFIVSISSPLSHSIHFVSDFAGKLRGTPSKTWNGGF